MHEGHGCACTRCVVLICAVISQSLSKLAGHSQTVGFGGMEVEDEVGRVLSMILCIAGVVIFSLLVVVVTRQLEFSDDEAVVWELVRRMQSLPELRRRAAATLDSTRQQVLRRAVGVVDEDDDGSASRSAISPELASASTDGSSSDSDSDGDDAAAEFGGVAGGSRLRSGSLGASFMAEPSEGIALVAARAAAGEETGRPGSMPPVGVAIQCEQAAAEAASHPVVASLPLDRAVMGAKPAGASAHGNTAKRAVDEDASNDASVRQMLSGLPTRLLLLFLAEQITEIQGIPARLARIEATLARLANQ